MATEFLPQILASTSYLPSILVPIVGWVFPGVAFAALFLYIEREDMV